LAAFNGIRRLTRLPPEENRKIAIGQLQPALTYGPELHHQPTEAGARLAARIARWMVIGYQGSSRWKIGKLAGIDSLEVLTSRERLR